MESKKIEKVLKDHENRLKKLEEKLSRGSTPKTKSTKKPSSVFDFLMELKDDGFFDKPKLLKDIVHELARRGYHYRTTSLTNPLQRALRQKKLGRVGKTRNWQYVKR